MKHRILLAALALLAAGCQTGPTKLTFDFGGTNKFSMTSSKEVSAGYMSLTNPNGVGIIISNYVSKVPNPSDALVEVLKPALEQYLKSRP